MSFIPRLIEKYSPKKAYYHYKAKLPTEHLLCSLDETGKQALLAYKDDTGHPQYRKYLNTPYWLQQNVARALYLGLNKSPPLSVLDIGCGFGYFPYAAHFYGHKVIGIDIPGDTLFNKASEWLGIDRRDYTIKPKTSMKSFRRKFDLVTAFQVCFNGHIEGKLWGKEEWDFFLEDLFTKHMNDGGKLYMELNWSQHIKAWLPEDAEALFLNKYSAKFDGPSRVTLFAPKG